MVQSYWKHSKSLHLPPVAACERLPFVPKQLLHWTGDPWLVISVDSLFFHRDYRLRTVPNIIRDGVNRFIQGIVRFKEQIPIRWFIAGSQLINRVISPALSNLCYRLASFEFSVYMMELARHCCDRMRRAVDRLLSCYICLCYIHFINHNIHFSLQI